MSFDLKSLGLFVRVAALGAIGRAGKEFNLSATNASQRIQNLESDLGVKLLNRTTRSVSLTPDGEVLLEHATRILGNIEEAKAVLSQHATSVSGLLRVTTSASFGRSHVVPFVPEFLRLYPDIKLDLNLTDSIIDIVEDGYDMAFRISELAPSSLLAQKIDDNPYRLVASPAYLERAGIPQKPEDLAHHSCIPLNGNNNWQFLDNNNKTFEVRVSGPISVNLGDAVGEWVLAGMGIAKSSLWHSGPALKDGHLVSVLPDFRIRGDAKIWAVRPPSRLMHARVKAFLDFMRDRIIATNKDHYGFLIDP